MKLDHVNVRTTRLDEMRNWYVKVLGFEDGWRPPFSFPGAWLYTGGHPIIHLVGVDRPLVDEFENLRLEHFALQGDNLDELRSRLETEGVPCHERQVPGTDILQLNVHDPDGNHIHVDFRTGEDAG